VPDGVGKPARRHRAAVIVALVVIVALLAGGAAIYWKRTQKSTSTPRPVASLILPTISGSYTLQADSVGDTGPSDLAKAIRDDGAVGAQAALTTDGFVAGYQRLWSDAATKQDVVVFLYQFRTPAGAVAYNQRQLAANKATAPSSVTTFSVPGLPGAVGLSAIASGAPSSEVFVTKGNYLIQAQADGTGAATVAREAQMVAISQYAVLPGR
jgi:hypothetical protein